MDTARLAHQHGLRNLFKSAFFTSVEVAAKLCTVIDIFSISIKAINNSFYRRITKGWLPPILEATKFVYEQGKHVEISNLMITDANDSEEDAKRIAGWVLDNLSEDVPLHFVRFHLNYRYTHVERTPVDRLYRAQETCRSLGLKYCYVGNVYDWANTCCPNCGYVLVERYGLSAHITGLAKNNHCQNCGAPSNIVGISSTGTEANSIGLPHCLEDAANEEGFSWHDDVNTVHISAWNESDMPNVVLCQRVYESDRVEAHMVVPLHPRQSWRFTLSRSGPMNTGVLVRYPNFVHVQLLHALDRAHYPTQCDMDGHEWTKERSNPR